MDVCLGYVNVICCFCLPFCVAIVIMFQVFLFLPLLLVFLAVGCDLGDLPFLLFCSLPVIGTQSTSLRTPFSKVFVSLGVSVELPQQGLNEVLLKSTPGRVAEIGLSAKRFLTSDFCLV